MGDLTVNKVRRNLVGEIEIEAPQALALLELAAIDNSNSVILGI